MLQSEGNKQHAQPFSHCTICPFLATSVRRLKILHQREPNILYLCKLYNMQNLIYSLDEITYFQYYSLFFVVRMTFLLSRSKAVKYIIHGNFHHCSFSCLIELFPKCQIEVCLVRGKCCENQKGNNKLKFACVRAST